jgi:hypothetical protein
MVCSQKLSCHTLNSARSVSAPAASKAFNHSTIPLDFCLSRDSSRCKSFEVPHEIGDVFFVFWIQQQVDVIMHDDETNQFAGVLKTIIVEAVNDWNDARWLYKNFQAVINNACDVIY